MVRRIGRPAAIEIIDGNKIIFRELTICTGRAAQSAAVQDDCYDEVA
jgi:hypothetical protein